MPLISVVVPVYQVQSYLRACLDSILQQSFTDIELVAVDDCSPDACGPIVDEYAACDRRVTVVHLKENVGLGRARNAGVERATGRYVWFVDSDDTITPGALEAIVHRIEETEPDVLLLDYARTYWWGREVRNMLSHLLRVPDAPEIFSIGERKDLLRIFPAAWNKVVRREFLNRVRLPFPAGWYEDVSFTYPVFAAAERISVLDRVCYHYRQRRRGTILGSRSDRHFELIGQYRLTFERLQAIQNTAEHETSNVDTVFSIVAGLAMDHCLVVLNHPGRLTPSSRHRFFKEILQLRRELRIAAYEIPPHADPVRHRLLAIGSWHLYESARHVHRLKGLARRKLRTLRRRIGRAVRMAKKVVKHAYYRYQRCLPLDDSLAVYSIYWGRSYGCNPAAIYEKTKELAPEIRGVWVVKGNRIETMPAGVEYVVENSLAYFKVIARAKWFFNNVNFADHLVKRQGTTHVQTHHGTTLKSMGVDCLRYPLTAKGTNFTKLLRRSDRWDYSIVSNTYSTEVWGRAYPCSFESLEYGYPRNDILVNTPPADRAKIRAELGILPHQRAVLFAPTHRDYTKALPHLVDLSALAEAAGPNSVILMRAHHFYDNPGSDSAVSSKVIDLTSYPRIEHLYLAADILITDYSSVMFDYGILNRPIVIFAPDWEAYRATRGTYFDLLKEPPGAVATTEAELLHLFEADAIDDVRAQELRARFRARFCHLDDGYASERVVRRIILNDSVDF